MAARCWLSLLLLLLALPGQARCCSIPVFRFALERWQPAGYEAVLFHRGELSPPTQALLTRLTDHKPGANLQVTAVDLNGKVDGDALKLWEKQGPQTPLPWLVVRFPQADEKAAPLWAGAPDRDVIDTLLDSPARRALVKHLTGGDSAVFVLLSGDDPAANEAAARMLGAELKRQQEKIQLPEQAAADPLLLSALPLRVRFRVLQLSREDPAERLFVSMLLRGDEDLTRVKGPIVLPIFGRGRMLCSLYGPDLTAERLAEAARFLCGECSCRVKELNPGIDMLLAAAWESALEPREPAAEKEAPGAGAAGREGEAPAEPEPNGSAGASPSRPAAPAVSGGETGADRRWLWLAIAGAGALVLLTGVWVWRSR
jgi:hypothetical protein